MTMGCKASNNPKGLCRASRPFIVTPNHHVVASKLEPVSLRPGGDGKAPLGAGVTQGRHVPWTHPQR